MALILSGGKIVMNAGLMLATGGSLNPQASAPWVGTSCSGGDQSYGQSTTTGFTAYSTAGPGTPAYTTCQTLGSYDLLLNLNGSFESWGTSSSGRTKQDLVATIKGQGTYPNVINQNRTPYVFLYALYESTPNASSGSAYQTWTNIVRTGATQFLFTAGGGGGSLVASAGIPANSEVNYAYANPTSAGSAALHQSIIPANYGFSSAGQSPAQTIAQYFPTLLITQNRSDARFSGLATRGSAPNADGIHWDNMFSFPNGGGNITANCSWDGVSTQPSATVAAYPTGASSLLAYGQAVICQSYLSFLASTNPGNTYLNCGNFGSYANTTTYGNTKSATSNALNGILHAGMLEAVGGVAGFGWQSYQTTAQMLANFDYGYSYLQAPALLGAVFRMPATDGSSTAAFFINGTNTTVSTNTALEYQYMRCMNALCHMRNVYFCPSNNGYNYALVRWYDESGDDSLTQVNVKRGWLGPPIAPPTTLSNGIMVRPYMNGCVAYNDYNGSAQTLTAAQLLSVTGRACKFLLGSQQPTVNSGANFSSYTMAIGDGLFLLYQ